MDSAVLSKTTVLLWIFKLLACLSPKNGYTVPHLLFLILSWMMPQTPQERALAKTI